MISENVIVNMYRVTSLTEEVQKIGYIFVKETSTVLFTTNKNNLDWEKPIKKDALPISILCKNPE